MAPKVNTAAVAPIAFRKTAATFMPAAQSLSQRHFISLDVFAEEQQKIFFRQLVREWGAYPLRESIPAVWDRDYLRHLR
jgi:hypothetical protein